MLCEEVGIALCFVSRGCPEADRQIERGNREIKRSIRRYDLLNSNTIRFDWLLEILVGLHMVV